MVDILDHQWEDIQARRVEPFLRPPVDIRGLHHRPVGIPGLRALPAPLADIQVVQPVLDMAVKDMERSEHLG